LTKRRNTLKIEKPIGLMHASRQTVFDRCLA